MNRFFYTNELGRAQKRMDGADVYGNKIVVANPLRLYESNSSSANPQRAIPKMKEEQESFSGTQKDTNLQFNNLYQCGQRPGVFIPMAGDQADQTLSSPTALGNFSKPTVPFFSNNNNFSHLMFPKVPNIENLKLSISGQPELCKAVHKPYFNNLDVSYSLAPGAPTSPGKCFRNKFTNILAHNQMTDTSPQRLNNCDHSEHHYQLQQQQMVIAQQRMLLGMDLQHDSAPHIPRAFPVTPPEVPEDYLDDTFFQPIQNSREPMSCYPVELHVSGLDPFLDLMVTKNLLTNLFKLHVEVLNVAVFCLTDGNVVASVKVPSMQDAQYAISQLQRCQVGTRRINIAFQNITPHQRELLRSQVMQLLSEMPNMKIPLFLFRERFKARFLTTVSVSELSRMKDVCTIAEDKAGRVITATTPPVRIVQSTPTKQDKEPYCVIHTKKTWSRTEPPVLPFVTIGLKTLTVKMRQLIESHDGRLPMASLADCYQAHFGALPENPQGVPIEHLVSCITGLDVVHSRGAFKYLTFSNTTGSGEEGGMKCVSPMLVAPMSALAKKLLELIQEAPRCIIEFSQFIPSYHRHYGRQCRVSDYGFTKLLDLLESMPHVIQVLGHGSDKKVTLSHKAQVRRFMADLTRVLKQKNNKQIDLTELPGLMEAVTHRPWDPCDYGLCELSDLIDSLPPNTVQLKPDGRTLAAVSVREQTPEEVDLTKQFAKDVVELLKQVPSCSMTFNKFVPAYHNHFGKQCRVTNYGFTKLVELFEAIPDTVLMEEDLSRGEKMVVLTVEEQMKVLGERVSAIVTSQGGAVLLSRLSKLYEWHHCGCLLAPEDVGCESLEQFLHKISDYVKLEMSPHGPIIVTNSAMDPMVLNHRTRAILIGMEENGSMPIKEFTTAYTERYHHEINVTTLATRIPHVVQLVAGALRLTHLSVFANQITALLLDFGGRLPLPSFESAYQAKFSRPCQPQKFGCPTLSALLASIPDIISLQDHEHYASGRTIVLNAEFKAMLPQVASAPHHSYDMWKGKALFPHPLPIPPHPSELPLPSASLSSPLRVRPAQQGPWVEATSTTDDQEAMRDESAPAVQAKRTSRLAAHFDNLTDP